MNKIFKALLGIMVVFVGFVGVVLLELLIHLVGAFVLVGGFSLVTGWFGVNVIPDGSFGFVVAIVTAVSYLLARIAKMTK